MRVLHCLILFSGLGLLHSGCTAEAIIAASPDAGTDSGGGRSDSGSSGDGGGTTPCTSNGDCGANGVCGFLESDSCTAQGQCFPAPGAVCLAYSPGCACDGSEISVACTGLPSGYASKPLLHTGVCTDAGGHDAGGGDATGGPCTTSADCGSNGLCGFAESAACAAQGQCFAAPGVVCNAYGAGCACDGTEVNIICNGLPTGYEPKALRHTGACIDGG